MSEMLKRFLRWLNRFFLVWLSLGMIVQFVLMAMGKSVHEPNRKIAVTEASIATVMLGTGIWGIVEAL